MTTPPPWIADLDEQDLTFVKRFLLASGSLKEVAAQYGVSYPTVRLRLDRLIQKNPPQRHGGSGPLRLPGEASGSGRQAGLRHREDFDCRLPGDPKENGG